MLAVVMGIGLLFASLAAVTGMVLPKDTREKHAIRQTTGASLVVFALIFALVSGQSVINMLFPGMF